MTRTAIRFSACLLSLWALAVPGARGANTHEVPEPRALTSIDAEMLDPARFAQWADGNETSFPDAVSKRGPQQLIWTRSSAPTALTFTFGDSKRPGPRHLRLALNKPATVGSVIVRGGGTLSVLKPNAPDSDLSREANWIAAQRLVEGRVSSEEVAPDEYAIWVLPPNTTTAALRFTHVAQPADTQYAGQLGAVLVLTERFADYADLATPTAGATSHRAAALINRKHDDFDQMWQRLDKERPAPTTPSPVSESTPEWVQLTWASPVQLEGIAAIWAGFGTTKVQVYTGPADRHPRDAAPDEWSTVGTYTRIQHGYPSRLWPNVLRFEKTVSTRAVRLLVTAPASESHPHLSARTDGGRNIWLGEIMALHPLGAGALEPVASTDNASAHPPIPIRFRLDKPGVVTLVIEDREGKRVRNLVSETPFPAGENTAWWDGTSDLARDPEAAKHGVYRIPAQFVQPGEYTVRGLVRDPIVPRYQFSVYSPGNPPWETADKSGGWLTNHSPPQAAVFVPGDRAPGGKPLVYLGSYVSEGGAGLAWVDLDGNKLGGQGWVGGVWTGAPFIAHDAGPKADNSTYVYVASAWHGQLRITALTAKGEKPTLRQNYKTKTAEQSLTDVGGIAAYDNTVVVSMRVLDQLMCIDATSGKVTGTVPLADPRGVCFDPSGKLLVLTRTTLLRYPRLLESQPETVLTGLEDAQQLALDAKGNFYISDRGASHQVKVFDALGKAIRQIGQPGKPATGAYEPLHLNNPAGLAIDERGQLWVTENDYLPKRVSIWRTDGKLLRAWCGPGKYGGGGTLDPQDQNRFYYADEGRGTLEFELDWTKGTSRLKRVLYRDDGAPMPLPDRAAAPETAIVRNGQRYFSNAFNCHPTGGAPVVTLFQERNGALVPVAAMGRANDWEVLRHDTFRTTWPKDIDLRKSPYLNNGRNQALFVWSDLNADAQAQPTEVQYRPCSTLGGMTSLDDLSLCVANIDGKALRFAPSGFTDAGVPRYDLGAAATLADGVQIPESSGGNQVLSDGKQTVVMLGLAPFSSFSVSGATEGKALWSYPNLWPGLHASHEAPEPSHPGELTGTTRLLGGLFSPARAQVGPLWAVNGNMGNVYVFTLDGLFVTTLFEDSRSGKPWQMPMAQRDMPLDGITLHQENFWPTISRGSDGKIYLVDGTRLAIVRLDGLDTLRPIAPMPLRLNEQDLSKAQAYVVAAETERQQREGSGVLQVAIRKTAPVVDGKLDDWANAKWVDIDSRGVAAHFNSQTKPYAVSGAVAIAGDRLYVAYRTGDAKLLRNTAELPTAPFKTGGALDLMLRTNPDASPKNVAAGDLRLLVTVRPDGTTMAVLYRPVVPGTASPVPFSSPWRTITIDRVDDVSADVTLAGGNDGVYELSIPLSKLGLVSNPRGRLRGDIGILRGNGSQTVARVYWSNKATGITADVPSEAMLAPQLWGNIEFIAE